tara:strand:- start:4076 stop:4567 length:492 start_codon:yes stop_codon:yes gene_type:complete
MKKSISLIGMAGAGKSSIGKKLASHLDFDFVDSDQLIEAGQNKSLQEILVTKGIERFKKLEEAALMSVEFNQTILATGGSAIFSKNAMSHIKQNSLIIYIEVPFQKILDRVKNFSERGFIKKPSQSIYDAFKDREKLYKKFADRVVKNSDDIESCFQKILYLL